MKNLQLIFLTMIGLILSSQISVAQTLSSKPANIVRQRISINQGWSFFKYDSISKADNLIYDVRPEISGNTENKVADAKPTEAVSVKTTQEVLKPWILPTGNKFINDPAKQHVRPEGNPGGDFPFVKGNFDDSSWEKVNLPHDWAIKGPFQKGSNSEVGGGMGRLPINGVAWYRKKLDILASDAGKSIFLDIDGAMSYAMVWLNGKLVGGWPYGYASWRLDLTPYVVPGGENQLAIRVDNPNNSARWYPGAGIYRNVWISKTSQIHVAQYGTYITTNSISKESASIDLSVTIDNDSKTTAQVEVETSIYALNDKGTKAGKAVASFTTQNAKVISGENARVENSVTIKNPKLWGPPPTQQPNLYVAVTTLSLNGKLIDSYETRFGIRTLEFNPDKGIFVNGEHIQLKGVNQHHDLGALGSAFNTRAAERQLEILREMGCNAIRMAHNPPAPELLELTDRMGFLVIDEIFDSWERKKTPHDFHLIFPDWSEPDTRAFVRRDRNCPSVIIWSFGNEVGEQYTTEAGAVVAKRLYDFVKEEDPTRPTTCAMNFAKPDMELPKVPDVIGLNYQGEGIRQDPEFEGTERIRTAPQYDAFHAKFPNKVILSAETASAFSSRGIYLFPVSKEISAPVRDGRGGDSKICQVTSYELHAVDFGSSADKVFGSIERHPFVAGEFVWNGFDYIGEPTPYYEARSSYSGIIDLAGFKKDRYYLYQSHWLPELPMAHILPHWNWPERVGQITPVHVFTTGDEAELFLNGKSLGKKKKAQYEYRLRWDDVVYQPGELKVIAYKNGKKWAEEVVKTTDNPAKLKATADRTTIKADGKDLSFITLQITDKDGLLVPRSNNQIEFSIDGPGEIVATDNGDSYNMESFASHKREAFNGLALVIVRSQAGNPGTITLTAKSPELKETKVELRSILLSSWSLFGQTNSKTKWVGTWATAPQLVETGNMPPSPGLTNNSLRQIVRVSIGGDTLRVRFSNEFSTRPVTMNSVQIAVSTGGNTIDVSTNKELKFNGNREVTMNAGVAITSDPIAFKLTPRMDVAITICFGQTSATVTGHPGSRTTSYLLAGNTTTTTDFTGAVTTDHWYNINAIDVKVPSTASCVAILGNSITDGRGSTTNMQNRWPDVFSESLLENIKTKNIGVLNLGIGGNCMLTGGLGPTALSRFERDILNQSRVRWAVIFIGVNDIGSVKTADAATTKTNDLIAAFKQMIVKAHAKNIRIYGATILPFNGNGYYNQYSESCRNEVNQWIRTKGNYDGLIDFDKAMRNPQDTTKLLLPAYQNDGLHPDATGYKVMGEYIDIKLFTGPDTIFYQEQNTKTKSINR